MSLGKSTHSNLFFRKKIQFIFMNVCWLSLFRIRTQKTYKKSKANRICKATQKYDSIKRRIFQHKFRTEIFFWEKIVGLESSVIEAWFIGSVSWEFSLWQKRVFHCKNYHPFFGLWTHEKSAAQVLASNQCVCICS